MSFRSASRKNEFLKLSLGSGLCPKANMVLEVKVIVVLISFWILFIESVCSSCILLRFASRRFLVCAQKSASRMRYAKADGLLIR